MNYKIQSIKNVIKIKVIIEIRNNKDKLRKITIFTIKSRKKQKHGAFLNYKEK